MIPLVQLSLNINGLRLENLAFPSTQDPYHFLMLAIIEVFELLTC